MTAALCIVTPKLLEGEICSLVVFLTRDDGGDVQLDERTQEAIDATNERTGKGEKAEKEPCRLCAPAAAAEPLVDEKQRGEWFGRSSA